jgi:hypothetical protein
VSLVLNKGLYDMSVSGGLKSWEFYGIVGNIIKRTKATPRYSTHSDWYELMSKLPNMLWMDQLTGLGLGF